MLRITPLLLIEVGERQLVVVRKDGDRLAFAHPRTSFMENVVNTFAFVRITLGADPPTPPIARGEPAPARYDANESGTTTADTACSG